MFPFVSMLSSILQLSSISIPPENVSCLTFLEGVEMENCCRILKSIKINGTIGTKWVNYFTTGKQIQKRKRKNSTDTFRPNLKWSFLRRVNGFQLIIDVTDALS